MAYQALYRKYRPTSFSDVVGQEHITETLKNELSSGKIFHAYLFTGTRGTGKTTCAKILAKAVNCLSPANGDPCGECAACKSISDGENTDVCEIDAASNNGVENIRDIRDRVNFAPGNSKYRVFIIDEVHMLSDGAFNALLKTIEEPPEHIIFILATTEVYKLPATVLSRCQRFDFKRIDTDTIKKRIYYIAEKEGFTVTDDAAALIASAADGGMRDALSILDLCLSNCNEITSDTVTTVCGMAKQEYLIELADCIKKERTEDALLLIDSLYSKSVDMGRLLSELITHYRNLMIIKTVSGGRVPIVCSPEYMDALKKQAADYDLKEILRILSSLKSSQSDMQNGDRRLSMEMAIIKLCNPNTSADIQSLERRIEHLEQGFVPSHKKTAENKPIPQISAEEEIPLPTEENPPSSPPENDVPTQTDNGDTPIREWADILSVIYKTAPFMWAALETSKAYIKDNRLLIDAPDPSFKELYSMQTNRESIKKAAEQVLGRAYSLGPYKKDESASEDPLQAFANKLKDFKNSGGN